MLCLGWMGSAVLFSLRSFLIGFRTVFVNQLTELFPLIPRRRSVLLLCFFLCRRVLHRAPAFTQGLEKCAREGRIKQVQSFCGSRDARTYMKCITAFRGRVSCDRRQRDRALLWLQNLRPEPQRPVPCGPQPCLTPCLRVYALVCPSANVGS